MAPLKILIGDDKAQINYNYVEPKLFLQLTGNDVPEPYVFTVVVEKENLKAALEIAKEFWGKRFQIIPDFSMEVLKTLVDL